MPKVEQHTVQKGQRRARRPTREQAQQRHEDLLDQALEQFLEKGFAMTTMDAIAASAGMTKPTVYGLYEDKQALFEAVVQRAIERWTIPVEALHGLDRDDLEGTLTAVARIRMVNANSPAGIRIQRIINAESYRFPDIYTLAYEQGTWPTIQYLANLLRHHAKTGTIKVDQPEAAATAFLAMIVGGPWRAIVWGHSIDEAELEQRIRNGVQLFLRGVRSR